MGFKSWRSYHAFSHEVTHSNRYFYSDDVKDFLLNVLKASETRETPVKSGSEFWRAQLGKEWEPVLDESGVEIRKKPVPLPPQRMKPVPFEASEGRVNPKGIPCLYLARTKETAMAEVRPWLDSDISVAQFKTVKEIRLVNCSGLPSHGEEVQTMDPDEWEKEVAVWADIDRAFSLPVTPNDKSSDYVPTQIIAELFKHHGYDGVYYRSALSNDLNLALLKPAPLKPALLNLALFDIDAARLFSRALFSVKDIQFLFEQSGRAYSHPSDSDM